MLILALLFAQAVTGPEWIEKPIPHWRCPAGLSRWDEGKPNQYSEPRCMTRPVLVSLYDSNTQDIAFWDVVVGLPGKGRGQEIIALPEETLRGGCDAEGIEDRVDFPVRATRFNLVDIPRGKLLVLHCVAIFPRSE